MHLIYARFINMFLYDIGVVSEEEPFKRVVHQGMILSGNEKMSKSKGNTISPDDYHPAVLRFYLMFLGHYFDGGVWSDQNISGIIRFFKRWMGWMEKTGDESIDVDKFENTVSGYTEAFKFNKVVSSFMILLNENKDKAIREDDKRKLNTLLSVYAPSFESIPL